MLSQFQTQSIVKASNIPFNISILNLNETHLRRMGQVSSLDIYDGITKNFHPEGLYSTKIFGVVGSETRYNQFGYIDLRTSIFHPAIFKALTQLKGLYQDIMLGKEFAVFDKEKQDFVKSNVIEGQTGFQFFLDYWKDIVFENRPSEMRVQNIKLVQEFKEKSMLDYILVMPAAYRDLEINDSGREESDEINSLYYKLIAISNTISKSTVKISPEAYNSQRISLQLCYNEIYSSISRLIEGKKNLLIGKWASRKIFNGTRNVLTSMNVSSEFLGHKRNIGFNSTAVGIYQTAKAILPITKFHLRNGFLLNVFSSSNAPAILTDKKTLNSVHIQLPSEIYDEWMTNEGIEAKISSFKETSIRHDPISIYSDYYLGLIYKGPDKTFKFIHGIDELPDPEMAQYCTPITLAQLLYVAIYPVANSYPIYVTRYPILGIGSIYPSKIFLKSTIKSEVRTPLGDDWRPLPELTAYEFPTESDFFNSMSPHSSRLAGLAADFDGDTGSGNVAYFDESVNETNMFFRQKRAYIGTDGNFIANIETDTLKYVCYNLSGE